ncbi:MAG TPA: acyltransferase [Kribbellaceae bacterium]|nr:acyltransferase [Kribbellaceae bacterium]
MKVLEFRCLNGLRALAATAVITTHVGFQTGTTARGGAFAAVLSRFDFGVALFFVLSGFLLTRPYLAAAESGRPGPDLRRYLWKRCLRILPTYWLTVAAAFALVPETRRLSPGARIQEVTLTQNYSRPPALAPNLTQMWSLAVEAAFYLALPALAWLLTRVVAGGRWQPRRLTAGSAVLICLAPVWLGGIRLADDPTAAMLALWLPAFLSWFGAGMALAVISVEVRSRASSWSQAVNRLARDASTWWLGAIALFAIAATPVGGPWLLQFPSGGAAIAKNLLYGAAAACLVLPLVLGDSERGLIRGLLAHPVANYLGELSYVMFCIHLIVIRYVYSGLDVELFQGRFGTVWLLTMAGTIAWSALIYRYVETPLRRFRTAGTRSDAPDVSTAATETIAAT